MKPKKIVEEKLKPEINLILNIEEVNII